MPLRIFSTIGNVRSVPGENLSPSTQPAHRRTPIALGVVALLAVLFLQLALSANRNSITWDEDDHIYAGYMSWKHGDFGLNPEHPPLVKLVAALPLLEMPLKMPVLQDRFFKHEAFLGGKDFFFKNDANAMLFRARMAVTFFTLLLALLVFLAAQEMFGTVAGFIALGLLVFDPNLLAHGAVVGTDVGLSCFTFASVYAFYRYVKVPSSWRLIVVGIATGLALICKHTGILVFPMLFLLAIWEVWRGAPATESSAGIISASKRARRLALALLAITAIGLTILWTAYGFRYQARAEGRQMNPPLSVFLQGLSRPREAHLLQTRGPFSSAARVLHLRACRRPNHVRLLRELPSRQSLSARGLVLFSGCVHHQIEPVVFAAAVADRLGDCHAPFHRLAGNLFPHHPAALLSDHRHVFRHEHWCAPHPADVSLLLRAYRRCGVETDS